MHYLRSFLLFSIIALTAIFLSSCQESPTTMTDNNPVAPSLGKFTLPAGAEFVSATFWIDSYDPKGNDVTVHEILSDWDENTVTWSSFGESFNPTIIGTFTNVVPEWKHVDVSGLVSSWLTGGTNYGLLLREPIDDPATYNFQRSLYHSREYDGGNYAPYLEIFYTFDGGNTVVSDTTRAIADTYIWQIEPTTNYGSSNILYTGARTAANQKKYSLIKFDFDFTPPSGGCTLTPGYWQTHSSNGPAPYDDTWALLGENTPFFHSNQTYFQALTTTSAGGNAYYILAFQYIAAQLNFLNGADPTDAQAAFDAATALFANPTNTPTYIGSLRGNNATRQQFISLAATLDNYNNGYIGPGHCDD